MKIKGFVKNLALVTVGCLVSAGAYMLYFYTVGIPKTQARNYYNQAIVKLEEGEREEAIKDLEKALTFWKEPYIEEQLKEVYY